jgi:hypothetical protein
MVSKGELHRLTGDMLKLTHQFAHLCTLLRVGGRNVDRKQQAQRVDHHVDLAASLAFVTVIARADRFHTWTATCGHLG